MKPKVFVFASGSASGGGSGFANLVTSSRAGLLRAHVVGVASNHASGGVRKQAESLGVPFVHFAGPFTADAYQRVAVESGADFFPLSGWLKFVTGLDLSTSFNARTVFNIHPGLLPQFGGPGMYGRHVHEAVMAAYQRGEVKRAGITMHFVVDGATKAEGYDRGPKFFEAAVAIDVRWTPEMLAAEVNRLERRYQPIITDQVVNGHITWDGVDPASLCTKSEYLVGVD